MIIKRKLFGIGQAIGNVATFGGLKNFQAMKQAGGLFTKVGAKEAAKGAAKTLAAAGNAAVGTGLALGAADGN